MKEEMQKILNDESYTTNEERVDAMAKALATLVIPKDKFNEETAKRKKFEEENASLTAKLASLETPATTTVEPKQEDERVTSLENEIKTLRAKSNRSQVESILRSAGLQDDDFKETLDTMDLTDESKALAYANSVVKFLNATTEKVKKETQATLLGDTPKPIVGGASASTATMDKLVKDYQEAIKSKDQVAQARLMREIQEERMKSTSNINK